MSRVKSPALTEPTETIETEWGVAYKLGGIYDVTVCESEQEARQLQAESGGMVVSRKIYTYNPRPAPRPGVLGGDARTT